MIKWSNQIYSCARKDAIKVEMIFSIMIQLPIRIITSTLMYAQHKPHGFVR